MEERIEQQFGAQISEEKRARDRLVVRTSIIGIAANLLLAAFKAAVGILSNSIAIVLDAVNNLSDAASSVITIVGTHLAGKAPDKKHPFGHGRIEYLTAMIIAILVLYAGIASLVESVKKILAPSTPDYSVIALVIVAVAVAVKLLLGRYVKHIGEKTGSSSLVNSGEDATMDAVISASTLVAAVIYLLFHLSLEAWLGAVISILIIKTGVEMLSETLSQLLGERADGELARSILKTVAAFPGVYGVYDLVLNNYGPDAFNGSLHIEVPDTTSANDLDELIREITLTVYQKHRVILTAVGVYSMNTRDSEVIAARKTVAEIVKAEPDALQMHGFYLNKEKKTIRFDVVISIEAKNRSEIWQRIREKAAAAFPDYLMTVTMDTDFSDLFD